MYMWSLHRLRGEERSEKLIMNTSDVRLSTYLDLSFCHVERKTADNNFAILWSSLSRARCGFDGRFRRLHSFFDTTDGRSFGLVSAESALSLLLAIDDAIQGLIKSSRHVEYEAWGCPRDFKRDFWV